VPRLFDLMRLLEAYVPHPEEERAYAEMLIRMRSGADVLSRYEFSPGHFTTSGFVVSPGGRLLLIFHNRLGKWLQPGGHIEPEDTDFWASARREVTEETGLDDLDAMGDGIFDIDVHDIPAFRNEPSHTHFDLRFLFGAAGPPIAGDGVGAVAWVAPAKVASYTDDRSVRRAVAKLS
jgi:8-oxo-dGTP pyrophosphatase MutT (NUDIX family)